MERVKMIQVGCGYVAQAEHIPAHLLNRDVELVAVVDSQIEVAKDIGEKFRVKWFGDMEECLSTVECDAVDISTPEFTHFDLAMKAIQASKHVLIEKPLAVNCKEGEEIIAAARQKGLKLMVAYMRRYDSDCVYVKQLIEKGDLGPVRAALGLFKLAYKGHFIRLSEGPKPSTKGGGVPSIPHSAAGSDKISRQLIHQINLLRYWLGEVKDVVTVKTGQNVINLMLEFNSGALGSLSHLNGMGNGEEVWVFGDEGNAHVRLWSPHLPYEFPRLEVFHRSKQLRSEVIIPRENPFTAEIAYFAKCILKNEEPRSPGEDALKDLELIEKIHNFNK